MDITSHVGLASILRLCLVVYGLYHDQYYAVKYTDIDYSVFTDAARYIYNGHSPFDRETYRYSPLLALILCPNIFCHEVFGKLLFSFLDILTGYFIYKILRKYGVDTRTSELCSCLWLYNPVNAIICTRGSCDSLMTMLVLLCIYLFQNKYIKSFSIIYGLTVHFRLYPCIHALTFYAAMSTRHVNSRNNFSKLYEILRLTKDRSIFLIYSAVGFFIPLFVSYYFYGSKFIEEAFLYHLVRKDIKHNFSPYFYFMYLSESSVKTVNILAFFPFVCQILLILLTTWVFSSSSNLPSCLFIQTFIFVTFNKVCTSQYFLWYLCLFPLTVPLLKIRYSLVLVLLLWLSGQALWLVPAYYLEFEGMHTFSLIWAASLIMFLLNVYLLYLFCKTCPLLGYDLINKKEQKR